MVLRTVLTVRQAQLCVVRSLRKVQWCKLPNESRPRVYPNEHATTIRKRAVKYPQSRELLVQETERGLQM